MADGDVQVSVETSDNLFKQFTVWHFDKIFMEENDKFWNLDKN